MIYRILLFLCAYCVFQSTGLASPNILPLDAPAVMGQTHILKDRPWGLGQRGDLQLKTSSLFPIHLNPQSKRSLVDLVGLKSPFDLDKDHHIDISRLNQAFDCFNCRLEDYYILANFIHGKKSLENIDPEGPSQFYIAVLPKPTSPKGLRVNNLIPQIQWFSDGLGAHAQIRFQLSHPILLLPQEVKAKTDWPLDILDLSSASPQEAPLEQWIRTAQVESLSNRRALWIHGDVTYALYGIYELQDELGTTRSWSAVDGILSRFGAARSLFSSLDRAQDQTRRAVVDQYLAGDLTDDQKISIFHGALARATSSILPTPEGWRYPIIYNTVFNSCITEALETLWAGGRGLQIADTQMFNPFQVEQQLLKAGAVKAHRLNEEYKGLNAEFGGVRLSPEPKEPKELLTYQRVQVFRDLLASDFTTEFLRSFAAKASLHQWNSPQNTRRFQQLREALNTTNLDEASLEQLKRFLASIPGTADLVEDLKKLLKIHKEDLAEEFQKLQEEGPGLMDLLGELRTQR